MIMQSNDILALISKELPINQIYFVEQGISNAQVFKIILSNGKKGFLKINADFTESLFFDKQIYEYLADKTKVPEVWLFKSNSDFEILCLSEATGNSLADLVDKIPTEKIVKLYAQALKELHNIPIENCPIIRPLQSKLEIVSQKIKHQLISSEDWEDEYKQFIINDLYTKLLSEVPPNEELVFTHGDFCLDNVIVNDEKLSGLIDMGRGGVADKYQDIALAVRSIRHDLGEEWISLFLKEYDIQVLDYQKVSFYILLDEFF
jgi:aminoglycoside phosphotransferase